MTPKCPVCYKDHEPDLYTWEKFDKPVYWRLKDDGASFKCNDCKEQKSHKDVYLTQLTCGARSVICKDCIDQDWLNEYAVSKGSM